MSLYEEKKGNVIQEFLQIGREQRFYLRNKNKPDSVNIGNVLSAVEALRVKNVDSFHEKENYLLSMLPPEERDKYHSKIIEELYEMIDKHITSLSDPELKRQYSGDRTKVRLEEPTTGYVEIIAGKKFAKQIIRYLKPQDFLDIAIGKKSNLFYKFSKDAMLELLEEENLVEDILGFAMKSSKEEISNDLIEHLKKRIKKNDGS